METNTNQETFVAGSSAAAQPDRNTVSPRLEWGAIFGGGVAALGIAAMLYALGLALGLSWIDPQDPSSLRPSGIFSGIWLVVVSLVALFVGGYVAARGAGVMSRGPGALHGLVMWGLSVVASAWLIGNVASAVVRGGAAVGGAAMSAVSGAMPSMGQLSGLPEQLGISSSDVLAPINQRLRSAGEPEVTAQQLENATRDVLQRSAREGRLDREMLTQAIAANTPLSRTDAEQIATGAEARFQAARADMQRRLSSAGETALAAAEDSGKAFWALFGALLLGMAAAIGGAVVGSDESRRSARRHSSRSRPTTGARHAEAYP